MYRDFLIAYPILIEYFRNYLSIFYFLSVKFKIRKFQTFYVICTLNLKLIEYVILSIVIKEGKNVND